jgi:3-methyladenine DNA glycosylase AlkD
VKKGFTATRSQTAAEARLRLREFSSRRNAETAGWFFKTGDGCYGADDRFVGVRVPDTRVVAREFRDLSLLQIRSLLSSKIHEERLLALIVLVNRARKSPPADLQMYSGFYLRNLDHVNNWDLVDVSAEHLLGGYLFTLSNASAERALSKLARSRDLWRRRVSIIATFYFIRRGSFALTFKIADLLLADEEDLIHKAVGWMLREVGNRDLDAEERFLRSRYKKMPRTMLRYAIEKFQETKRRRYLER